MKLNEMPDASTFDNLYTDAAEGQSGRFRRGEDPPPAGSSGEKEFHTRPRMRTDRGIIGPVTRGPLAGIDLVAYMRTGVIRRLDGGALTEAQRGLR